MANRVEIFVDVDPTGRGAAAIRGIRADVRGLERDTSRAGQTGRNALEGFAGGLGIPTSVAAVTAAIGAGIVGIGVKSVQAANAGEDATRTLKAAAMEAGIAFGVADARADELAKDLGITQTQAELATAKFSTLVKAAGETANFERHQKALTDVIAAYGLGANEIESLTSQLINGQDEALNRLGISDPSKLYREYALSVNRTVDSLTEEERTRVRLLAVTEKGERLQGFAAERLASQSGLWQQLSTSIGDAARNLGDYLQKQTFIGDIPGALMGLSPEEVADARHKAAEARALAEATAHADALDASLANTQKQLDLLKGRASEFDSFEYLVASRGEQAAKALRQTFIDQYTNLFKDKELDAVTATFAEEQFKRIKNILPPDKRDEIAKGLATVFKNFQKEAATYLKGVRAEAEALFSHLAERYVGEANNPFVKIFTEADEAAHKLEKTFGILGDKVVDELQGIEAAYYRQQTLAAQLDATLSSSSLRRQAEAFLNPRGLSGQDEAAVGILERRLDLIRTEVDVNAKIAAIQGGLGKGGLQEALERNREGALGQEFRQLQELLKDVSGSGRAGQEQRDRIYERIAGIFEELSPDTQRRISRGEIAGGDTFLAAYQGIKDRQERRLQDEIERAGYLDEQVEAARRDLADIERARAEGLETGEADRRLLARLKELPENLRTPDLRGEGFEAANREADRLLTQQGRARDAVERSTEATTRLTSSVDNLASAMKDPKQRELLIRILNKSKADVRDDMYGTLQPLPPSADSQ